MHIQSHADLIKRRLLNLTKDMKSINGGDVGSGQNNGNFGENSQIKSVKVDESTI